MDCERMKLMLDPYIDGELDQTQVRALLDHAKKCESCAEALRTAELLRDALRDMDGEIGVPLEAQAGWRAAVKREAQKKRANRYMRFVYAAAVALAVFFGGTLVRDGIMENRRAADIEPRVGVSAVQADAGEGLIARDGEVADAVEPQDSEVYAAWKKIGAADLDKARGTVEALVAEYSGSFTLDSDAPDGAIYRIELPYDYMADFLNAASRIGRELDSETVDALSDTAIIYIQLLPETAE